MSHTPIHLEVLAVDNFHSDHFYHSKCKEAILGDALKSNQGSNETRLVGEIEAQVGGNNASVIAGLVKNSWD